MIIIINGECGCGRWQPTGGLKCMKVSSYSRMKFVLIMTSTVTYTAWPIPNKTNSQTFSTTFSVTGRSKRKWVMYNTGILDISKRQLRSSHNYYHHHHLQLLYRTICVKEKSSERMLNSKLCSNWRILLKQSFTVHVPVRVVANRQNTTPITSDSYAFNCDPEWDYSGRKGSDGQ